MIVEERGGGRSVGMVVVLLLILYVIQAVPMGLSSALPLSLQGRGATYADLAKFSVAALPFTLKLLWAPIVDSTHLGHHGRRKSWLVPVQLLCSASMIGASMFNLPSRWAGESDQPVQIIPLTAFFFALYLLMATQDIAVDGWALEILPPKLRKHASTCNTIGQSIGFYATNITFLLFNHVDNSHTSNPWVSLVSSMNVTLDQFLYFWGIVIGVVTLFVAFVVKEDINVTRMASADAKKDLVKSYKALYTMICLKPVQLMCVVLMTCRLPFGPIDAAATLKILETGAAKEVLAILAPIAFPVGIATSYLTGRLIGRRFTALGAFKAGYVLRLTLCTAWLGVYKYARAVGGDHGSTYSMIVVGICLQAICSEAMFVSQMAFFAQVSDVSMGGTYMTFFNTVANLGNKWPSMLMLAIMDRKPVVGSETFVELTCVCFVIGIVWLSCGGSRVLRTLENVKPRAWELSSDNGGIELAPLTTEDSVDSVTMRIGRKPDLSTDEKAINN